MQNIVMMKCPLLHSHYWCHMVFKKISVFCCLWLLTLKVSWGVVIPHGAIIFSLRNYVHSEFLNGFLRYFRSTWFYKVMLPSFRSCRLEHTITDHSWWCCHSQTTAVLLEASYQRGPSHLSLRWWRRSVSESFSLPLSSNETRTSGYYSFHVCKMQSHLLHHILPYKKDDLYL